MSSSNQSGGTIGASGVTAQIHTQLQLLDACLAAEQLGWARVCARQIGELSTALEARLGGTEEPAARKKQWIPPSAAQVRESLLRVVGKRKPVEHQGPLVICTLNGFHLKADKAARLIGPLMEIVRRAHVICFQESNVDALRLIARKAKYGLNASHRNSREQACGILFHPRLEWLGDAPVYHDYLLTVPDHPEMQVSLRPAIQRRVIDRTSSFVFDIIDLHAKSNVGGADETRPIRRHQFEQLVEELKRQQVASPYQPRAADSGVDRELIEQACSQPLAALILAGDFNAPLENPETTEVEPLLDFGLQLQRMPDDRWTHEWRGHGGQFDGFLLKDLGDRRTSLWSPRFPESRRDRAFYREVSDHLPVFLEVAV